MEGGFPKLFGLINEHIRDPEMLGQPRIDGDVFRFVVVVVVVVGWASDGLVGSVDPVFLLDPDPLVDPHHPNGHLHSDNLLNLQNLTGDKYRAGIMAGNAHFNSEGGSWPPRPSGQELTGARQAEILFHFQNNLVLTIKYEEVSCTDTSPSFWGFPGHSTRLQESTEYDPSNI